MADDTLFGWVHLSDIHVGHGDKSHGWDQELVLDRLCEDFADARRLGAPAPDALLITGDIAFSGAGRSPDEYDRAKARLLAAGAALGLGPDRVFTVPGNHDVDRGADRTPFIASFVDSLRKGETPIDTALADESSRALLAKRMAKYLEMSADFAPACLGKGKPASERLFWAHTIDARGGLRVRLVGLNTALLSRDDTDKEKLHLGKEQLALALQPAAAPGEVIVLLSHHPFDWLGDGQRASEWIASGAHLHLSGHVHEADTVQVLHGTGSRLVRVTAGAAHGDALPAWIPASHGYNFGGIVRDEAGKLSARVWPRRWAEKAKRFRVDTDSVGDGERYATHDLGVSVGEARNPKPPVPPGDADAIVATYLSHAARAAEPPDTSTKPAAVVPTARAPVEVFIFYSPKDDELRDKLEDHLSLLRKRGTIQAFSARSTDLGADRAAAIDAHIESARVFLVLVSASFLASDFFGGRELDRALERGARKEAMVIPIALKPADWKTTKLGALQGLPRDNVPVSKRDHDEALAEIATELRQLIEGSRK